MGLSHVIKRKPCNILAQCYKAVNCLLVRSAWCRLCMYAAVFCSQWHTSHGTVNKSSCCSDSACFCLQCTARPSRIVFSECLSVVCVHVYRVGAAMLRGEYEQAVRLIMQPREGDREEGVEARRLYLDKGDIEVQYDE